MKDTLSTLASVSTGLDHHVDAFHSQNLDQILLDYTDQSMVTVYDMRAGQENEYKGPLEITTFFEGLFGRLNDLKTFETPVTDSKVHEGTTGSAFRVWKCPSSGIELATDTFLLDGAQQIVKQTMVLWTTTTTAAVVAGAESSSSSTSKNIVTSPSDGLIYNAWNNHLGGVGAQDVSKILLDYTEDSIIVVFDQKSETKSVYAGLSGVEELFITLFADLRDLSELTTPCIRVTEQPGAVFLIWKCPSSNVISATDTILFDEHAKIKYQTVVIEKK